MDAAARHRVADPEELVAPGGVRHLFETLSAQIWMFCAVLGVRYAYAVDAMVADDTALLRHLSAHDEPAAVSAWHRKMDDALAYMLAQLDPA